MNSSLRPVSSGSVLYSVGILLSKKPIFYERTFLAVQRLGNVASWENLTPGGSARIAMKIAKVDIIRRISSGRKFAISAAAKWCGGR